MNCKLDVTFRTDKQVNAEFNYHLKLEPNVRVHLKETAVLSDDLRLEPVLRGGGCN